MVEQRAALGLSAAVGDGNLAVLMAMVHKLQQAGIRTNYSLVEESARFAGNFHKIVSGSPIFSAGYSKISESLRRVAMPLMGRQSRAEIERKNPELRNGHNPYDVMFTTQEHILGHYRSEDLVRLFPGGSFLYAGDVFPKMNAVDVVIKRNIQLLVWNEAAMKYLESEGVEPFLVEPVLRGVPPVLKRSCLEERVVVKTSGSATSEGMDDLRIALERTKIPFRIYLPREIITEEGRFSRGETMEQRMGFYGDLLAHPPKLLIAGPSEMVMVAAVMSGLEVSFLPLPSRGQHERKNLEWAREKGLCFDILDPQGSNLEGKIKREFNKVHFPKRADLGLGNLPVVDALFR